VPLSRKEKREKEIRKAKDQKTRKRKNVIIMTKKTTSRPIATQRKTV
jgi:hypothetical protein